MENIHIFFERILEEYQEDCTITISYPEDTIKLHTKYFGEYDRNYNYTITFSEFELKQFNLGSNPFWKKLAETTIKDINQRIEEEKFNKEKE